MTRCCSLNMDERPTAEELYQVFSSELEANYKDTIDADVQNVCTQLANAENPDDVSEADCLLELEEGLGKTKKRTTWQAMYSKSPCRNICTDTRGPGAPILPTELQIREVSYVQRRAMADLSVAGDQLLALMVTRTGDDIGRWQVVELDPMDGEELRTLHEEHRGFGIGLATSSSGSIYVASSEGLLLVQLTGEVVLISEGRYFDCCAGHDGTMYATRVETGQTVYMDVVAGSQVVRTIRTQVTSKNYILTMTCGVTAKTNVIFLATVDPSAINKISVNDGSTLRTYGLSIDTTESEGVFYPIITFSDKQHHEILVSDRRNHILKVLNTLDGSWRLVNITANAEPHTIDEVYCAAVNGTQVYVGGNSGKRLYILESRMTDLASNSPRLEVESTRIEFVQGVKESYAKFTDPMDSFLRHYEGDEQVGENVLDCTQMTDENIANRPPDKVCRFRLDILGRECTFHRHYGYNEGQPCILLRLERIWRWYPELYTNETLPDAAREMMGKRFDPNYIGVTCEGETASDAENMGPVEFYPPGGFSKVYYPYTAQPNYMQPLVFARFSKVTSGVLVQVRCRAWTNNIDHARNDTTAGVVFELLVN